MSAASNTVARADIDPAALCSIEAEQGLLGAILNSNGAALDVVDGIVTASDFGEPVHRLLFEQFAKAREIGRAINLPLAVAALGPEAKAPLTDTMTIGHYLARLAAEATTIVNAPDFAKVVREFSDRRKISGIIDALVAGVASSQHPGELAVTGIEMLDTIATSQFGERRTRYSLAAGTAQAIDQMTVALQNAGKLQGITTGLRDIDAKTGGLRRGNLVILAGRPGMGKTAFAISLARQTAEAGNNVLYFSHEMTAAELSFRALADRCFNHRYPIAYSDIQAGWLTNEQAEQIVLTQRELQALPLELDDQASLTVPQIAARARKHKQALERKRKTLDLLIVDHMHIVRATDRYSGNKVAEVTEISGGLKALAKDLNVPVVALAQLSRNVETRDDKRPTLSDLRESGAIEQDADLIIFLYREAYYLARQLCDNPIQGDGVLDALAQTRNELEAIIAKQRNGPTCTVKLFCNIASNAIRDMARIAE